MSLKCIHPSVTSPSPPPSFANLANRELLAQHLCGFTTPPHKATRWIYVGDRCHSHVPAPPEHPISLSERALWATGTLRCADFSASMNISPSRTCAEFRPVLGLLGLCLFIRTFGHGFPSRKSAFVMITVRYPRCKRRASSQNRPIFGRKQNLQEIK